MECVLSYHRGSIAAERLIVVLRQNVALAQTVEVKFFQEFGNFALGSQSTEKTVKKLGRHRHKHLFTPSLGFRSTLSERCSPTATRV